MNNAIPEIIGWHFAADKLRDGTPLPKPGQELPAIDDLVPCGRGYHLSVRAIDAIGYAQGFMVARVRGFGAVPHGDPIDKYACRRRVVLAGYVNSSDVVCVLVAKWAHRAVAVHAAAALRADGRGYLADKLAAIKPWDWRDRVAADAARDAVDDAAIAVADKAVGPIRAILRTARGAAVIAGFVGGAYWVPWDAAWTAMRVADLVGKAERDLHNAELEAALRELLGVTQ